MFSSTTGLPVGIYFTLGIFVKTYCYIRYLLANRNLYLALIWSPLYRDIEPPFKGIFTGKYEIRKLPKKRSLLLLFGYLFVLTILGIAVATIGLTSPTTPSDYPQALSHISIDTWFSVILFDSLLCFFVITLSILTIKDWGIYLFKLIKQLYFSIIKRRPL